MKKVYCFIVAVLMALSLSAASADGFSGWWTDEAVTVYFGEDGLIQIWKSDASEIECEYFATIEQEGDGWILSPFANASRYTQSFADEEGWMSLVDENGAESAWLNATPEDVINQGLALREDMPLVGVWTQMTDDLTAPCFQFYDDGYFDYEDLLGVEETQQLFGKYQLENGLLSLYTEDTGMNWTLRLTDEGAMKLHTKDGEDVSLTKMDSAKEFPNAEGLIGTWENDTSSMTFHQDGTLDMAGIPGYGTWSLNGARLVIRCDDPLWSFASYVTYSDETAYSISITQADGSLHGEYRKK